MDRKLVLKIPSTFGEVFTKKVKPAAQKAVDRALLKVAARIVALVTSEAKRESESTGALYEKALKKSSAVRFMGNKLIIKIEDPTVLAIEDGLKSYDIKQYMLKHGTAGKNGSIYVDVPFTHSARDVPQGIRNQLRSVSRVNITGAARRSSKMRNLSGVFKDGRSYKTIRRISNRSDPKSWIHPGFKGLKLFEKLAPRIKAEAVDALVAELKAAGVKASAT